MCLLRKEKNIKGDKGLISHFNLSCNNLFSKLLLIITFIPDKNAIFVWMH